MAQIIRHRRGSLEALSAVTSSFQKGELIIVSGSSNITASNGTGMVFAAVESGSIQAVNRFLIGDNAPNVFPAGTYNGLVKGVPYYASGSSTLYLLGEGANEIIDLTGNISNFSSSVSASISALSASIGGGNIGTSVAALNSKTGSYATTGSNIFVGYQTISASVAELRLENSTTGKAYHIANTGTELVIHGNTGVDIIRIESGSGYYSTHIFGNLIMNGAGTISGSINGIGNVSAYSASVDSRFSASAASVTALSASVASVTGDFSASVATSFSASNASLTALSASVASVTGDFSASVAQTFTTQSQRISSLESFSGSYATTGSNTFRGEQIISSSLIVTNEIKGTGSIFLQPDVTDSRKLEIYNTSVTDVHIKATGGQTFLGDDTNFVEINDSLQTINITAANGVFVTGIEETIGEFSQSVDSRFSASVASVTSLSASVASVTGDFSSSVATSFSASAYNVSASNASQDIRINQLASFSGSYATTGSNIFFGTQTFTGSVYITQDLIVQGSSSLQNVTASAVSIGTNQINLNTDFPAFRYAGLNVYDSGSSGVSASLQWDSLTDQWIFVHKESGSATVDSSILLYGPLSTGGLGTETGLTSNYLTKVEDNGHGHHLTTSSIEDTGTKVTVYNSLDVTGEISASTINGIGNVTAYSQSVSASLAAIVANVGSGVGVSITNLNSFSSSQLTQNSTLATYTASVETRLTEIGVVSGSLIASASTAKTTNDTQDGRLTNLEATSASVNTSVTALNSSSASQQISIDALNTVSGSNLGRLSNLESTSASLNTSVAELNTSSASQQVSLDNLNTFSGSTLGRLTNLESTSASVNTSVSALNSSSASQQISIDALNIVSGSNLGRLSNLESTSASVNISITNINSFSSSVLTQLTEIGVVSGSLIASASAAKTTNDAQGVRLGELESKSSSVDIAIAALNSYTSSNTSTTALNAFTASANERFTEIGVVSGSLIASASTAKTTNDTQDGRLTELETASGSFNTSISNLNTTSASVNTSIAALNASSASQQTQLDGLSSKTGSYATTGSNTFYGTQTFSGSINVSGSTNFGGAVAVDDSNMNLTNSSSLNLTNGSSIYVNGSGVISGSIVGIGNVTAFSTSVDSRLSNLQTKSASVDIAIAALNSYTSSNTSTTALNAFTASANERFTEIGVVSGSLISSASAAAVANANQNLFTQSADVRLTNLESTSASVNTSITNINGTTASLNTSVSNLNTFSASVNTSITNINSATASLNTSVAALNSYSSSLKTAFELTGSNVVVLGDFTVRGTQTIVDSTTIQIGDNIIELNGTGATNGGLYVKDVTAPNTATGSLLWDSTNDYWKAGVKDSEYKILLANGDNVVSGGAQIPIADLDGYTDYNDNILLEFSASNASITALSASVASVTGDFSASVATSFSASNASITALSASVASVTGDFSSSVATSFSASAASQTLLSSSFASSQATQNGRLDLLETSTGSLNLFTSSIDTTIKTKLNVEGVVSGSSQIDIANTTGYSTFSGSIATSISASVAAANWENLVGKPEGIVSGSIQVDITQTTGFSTFSASIETRISVIDGGTY
jgi:uncharacterized coiled-coil protein SlyX